MGLITGSTLFENKGKIELALERFKIYGSKGLHIAFSGGKDSIVLEHLAKLSKINYDIIYNNTTVDPPEVIKFIKQYYPNTKIKTVEKGMFGLIPKNGLPYRNIRWCCRIFKEQSSNDILPVATGVRWAESINRRKRHSEITIFGKSKNETDNLIYNLDNDEKRRLIENCIRTNKILINPIIDWTDKDIWDYIRINKLPYCSLYDEGWKRIGCIGCPNASRKERLMQFKRYPKYETAYKKALQLYLKTHEKRMTFDQFWDHWLDGPGAIKLHSIFEDQ